MLKITSGSALLLVATLFITACGGSTDPKTDKPTDPPKAPVSLSELASSLGSEAECTAKGGKWQPVGKLQQLACVLPTSDAGKACTDKSECEVFCLTSEPDIAPGTAVTGQCNDSTNIFGCKTHVTDGKAEPTLCID